MRSDPKTDGQLIEQKVRVWDLPTRLFHWTLVTLIACAYVSFQFSERIGDLQMRWHKWNGYALLTLVVWRLLWGLFGSSTSRWANFVTWPWRAAGYGFDLLRGRDRHFLGHNPLGTYMILALLGLVGLEGLLGLFTLDHNDMIAGPLKKLLTSEEAVKRVSSWHRQGFDVILIFVGLHVVANLFYQLFKKDPLITGMITGSKPARAAPHGYEDEAEADIVAHPMLRALVCLIVAGGIVLGGIVALGGKLG